MLDPLSFFAGGAFGIAILVVAAIVSTPVGPADGIGDLSDSTGNREGPE